MLQIYAAVNNQSYRNHWWTVTGTEHLNAATHQNTAKDEPHLRTTQPRYVDHPCPQLEGQNKSLESLHSLFISAPSRFRSQSAAP